MKYWQQHKETYRIQVENTKTNKVIVASGLTTLAGRAMNAKL